MKPIRILMIDDEERDYQCMREAFGARAELTHAVHASEALEQLRGESRFDLILLDQMWDNEAIPQEALVDMDGNLPPQVKTDRYRQGEAILKFLGKNKVRVPVVYCSRLEKPEVAIELCKLGVALDFFPKRDLHNHPEWLLYLLEEGGAARLFLRRVLRAAKVARSRFVWNWLLGLRNVWRREWAPMVQELSEEIVSRYAGQCTPAAALSLQEDYLPDLENRYRQEVVPMDFHAFRQRRGLSADVTVRNLPGWPIWLELPRQGSGPLCLWVEPGAVDHTDLSLPADWPTVTASWHAASGAAVLPVELTEFRLGPHDPFWGGERWLMVKSTCERSVVNQWSMQEDAPDGRLVPWSLRAGRIGYPGHDFWPRLQQTAEAIRGLADFSERAACLGATLAVSLEGRLELLPVPKRLLHEELASRVQEPRQQLLSLHRGTQVPALSEEQLTSELQALPSIEIRKAGWLHVFEEETLQVVLDVVREVKAQGVAVWAGCDFLHLRLNRRKKNDPQLIPSAREYDNVILAPQGICVLECKCSDDQTYIKGGHTQVKKARETLWCNFRGRPEDGGIFLKSVLLERLAGVSGRLPKDVCETIPVDLRNRLEKAPHTQWANIIEQEFATLESKAIRIEPGKELYLDDFVPNQRNNVPAVIGFLVAPKSFYFTNDNDLMRKHQVFVLGKTEELPEMLRRWLRMPPVFDKASLELVRSMMLHMAEGAEVRGLPEFGGFEGRRVMRVDSWRLYVGTNAWIQQPECWLVRSLEQAPERDGPLRNWFVTALRNLSGAVRFLDVQGLPATHFRHLHRIALVLPGDVFGPEYAASWSPSVRLRGIAALLELLEDESVAVTLGAGCDQPTPLAQQLGPRQPYRWGWLPGLPDKKKSRPDPIHGIRKAFPALLRLLHDTETDPTSKGGMARQVLALFASQLQRSLPDFASAAVCVRRARKALS